MLGEDKAQHQSCHLTLWIKKAKPGEWNKCNAELAPASCLGGRKAVVASRALSLSPVNYISSFSTARCPTSLPTLNAWVRFSPFTCINSSHLQFVKGSLAPLSTKEDNRIELILLADFSCYLKERPKGKETFSFYLYLFTKATDKRGNISHVQGWARKERKEARGGVFNEFHVVFPHVTIFVFSISLIICCRCCFRHIKIRNNCLIVSFRLRPVYI